ncbi:helix-turn-helix domain containing protein [Bacillus pseudomycoides]|uniref:helix-turn-helix domain containing protein n=1 Tax=Bacillus pseudomycoides TaxID=64104 RepID=UPI000BF5B697|nr:helix-turn-helix domain containing protein [Bacillus pseudomycoides]PGD26788.1 helix-turn-helix domain containing protein [Bacillus pseudomycoides]PHG24713.1 helix-turn-helix domain containing protein [Bacillus pseudomycoides]
MPTLISELQKEDYTIESQQRKYMKKASRNLYIALEEANLVFDESEVIQFKEMWKEGHNIIEIAKQLGRHQLEIAVLILDQADKNKIQSRPIGLGA